MIAVKADSPHKTLKDLMDAARKNPGKVKQSGGSPMSRDGVVRAMLQKATGAQWAFISFPGGGERIAALLGGHVDFMIVEPQEAGEHIRNGNLRVIAQVNEKRLEKYANVPTIKEAGFNVPYYAVFRGIVGPPEMPRDAVAYYENFFERLVKTDAWKKYLAQFQWFDAYADSATFAKDLRQENEVYSKILSDLGMAKGLKK